MQQQAKDQMIAFYRDLFQKHGSAPEACGVTSEGQHFRFSKLAEVADLKNQRILDLACGIGDFYPFLINRFGSIDYTGIDIVPETVSFAARQYPLARFQCRDIQTEGIDGQFDYVLISMLFNNDIPADCDGFMREMLTIAFQHCSRAIAFNFTSTHANYRDADRAYHDPAAVLGFCLQKLTRKVTMHHHYERCDVAVFAYR
jgi:SAM-dependent methyltransferase